MILINHIILFLLLLITIDVQTVMAGSEECVQCHQEVTQRVETKIYTHKPVIQNQCELCHLPTTTEELINDVPEPLWVIENEQRTHIEWLAESFVENKQQSALLPLDVSSGEIIIKLWYKDRTKRQDEISCPAIGNIQLGQAPNSIEISQLHRQSYNDQLMPRTTLHWTTNVPCRCKILYRTDNNDYEKDEDDFYTVNHLQEIKNFNAQDTTISIHCESLYRQQSEIPYLPLEEIELIRGEVTSPVQPTTDYTTNFRRMANAIELEIVTLQPATVAIGRIEQKQKTTSTEVSPQLQTLHVSTEKDHQPLSDKKQVNTTICYKCHRSTVTGASHPINVTAPPGMIIPSRYPLLSDGKLTCMTCHSRHASNNEARLLMEGKKELCTGCHTNY